MTGPSPCVVRLTLACGLWQFAVLWLTKPLTTGGESWVPTVGAHIITLVIVLLVGAALWRNESRHRRPPEPPPVGDPTDYLTDADREWLTGHGWEPPPAAPVTSWAEYETRLRRERAREAQRIARRNERREWAVAASHRFDSIRSETSTSRSKYLVGPEQTAACSLCDWRAPVNGRDDALAKLRRHHRAEHSNLAGNESK